MSESAHQAYASRDHTYGALLAALDRRQGRLANLRTVTFLVFLAVLLLVAFQKLPRWALFISFGSLAGFVLLAVVHARAIREEARAAVLKTLNSRGLARLTGAWRAFTQKTSGLVAEGHVYATDLDLVGQGSLVQRIDETGTKAGQAQLVAWLASAADTAATIRARQGAVKELTHQLDFRQTLVTEARMAGSEKADPSKFIAWAEGTPGLGAIRWAFPLAHVLPPITITLGMLSAYDVIAAWPFYLGLLLQIAVVATTKGALNHLWESLAIGERGFARFEQTFAAIDAQKFVHPRLIALQSGIQTQGSESVSVRLRRFARLMGFAELKASGQLHPIINALTLWDIHVLFRIEAWRVADGRGVRSWFESLAQLEALSCFAGYAFENPDAPFPEVDDGPGHLVAKQLAHPLIDHAVRNDVELASAGGALVITGSNMSGKTTLMRAMGLNTVMALAGMPVCARSMRLSRMQVMTSMRVKDSLERGVSYFYAEVQRIKLLLDTAAANRSQSLFLLDELFMGTNTRERQIASKHLLRVLLDSGAIGAVTTHDLSICELESERPGLIRNVHFRDLMHNGQMTFDYTLREGIVTTTNALEVLRTVGIFIDASETTIATS
jgi:hypothetical protein